MITTKILTLVIVPITHGNIQTKVSVKFVDLFFDLEKKE